MSRIVSWFSCGAASAVASKLAIEMAQGREVVIAYCDTFRREHPDNRRFFDDCQRWFGQKIIIVGNDAYDRDPDVVFRKERFLVGPTGAKCTGLLKRQLRWDFQRPTDTVVIGFTAEEYELRHKRLAKAEPMTKFWPVLHEQRLSKRNCLELVMAAGIELPAMYRLGYKNNNCIGCVKGQAGYWNKIRIDFPERFAEMAVIERELGRTVCKQEIVKDGVRTLTRVYLDEMSPTLGHYDKEPDISCGVLCESANRFRKG